MFTRRATRAVPLAAAAILALGSVGLGGCGNAAKRTEISLENQSAATLDVVAALPGQARVMRTRATHEGYVARVMPGEIWETTPDRVRSAVASNNTRAVRLEVTDVTDRDDRVPMEPILVEPRNRRVRVRFFGQPGDLQYEVIGKDDLAELSGDLRPVEE